MGRKSPGNEDDSSYDFVVVAAGMKAAGQNAVNTTTLLFFLTFFSTIWDTVAARDHNIINDAQ